MLDPGLVAWCEQHHDRSVAEELEYHEGLERLRSAGKRGCQKRRPRGRPGIAGPTHDEAVHENLGGLPLGAAGKGSRHVAQRAVDGAEAGSQPHRDAQARAGRGARQLALLAGPPHRHRPPALYCQRWTGAYARTSDSAFRARRSSGVTEQKPWPNRRLTGSKLTTALYLMHLAATPTWTCLAGFHGVSKTGRSTVQEVKRMAAGSAEFAPVLPAACPHRGVTRGDIVLAAEAIRANLLPPLRLMQWTLAADRDNLAPSDLAPVLDALLDHGREGFPVAVHLICRYATDAPARIAGLWPKVARIAAGVTRWDHAEGDAMTEHRFKSLMAMTLKRGRQDSNARALALTLAGAFVKSLGTENARLVEPLLPRLLSDFPEIAWPLIGQAAISETSPRRLLEFALGEQPSPETQRRPPILHLPLEALFAWCRAHPERAPVFAAATVPLLEADEAGAPTSSLHPVMLRIIDEFGHRQGVLEAVSGNMGSFNRVSAASSVLHLAREPPRTLQGHRRKEVREWASVELCALNRSIKIVKARDAALRARIEI